MGGKSNEQKLAEIHAQAMAEFDAIQTAQRDVRMQCLEARRFYSIPGAQWEGPLGEQFDNKPRFEFNKVHLAVIRIFNEYRNNRITVDFTAKDGSQGDKLADTCDGLYRADEQACVADEAYDNGFEEGVGGGFGAWRLRTRYEHEDDEDDDDTRQRIIMEPITDADSCVFFDNDAKRYDKSDARRCFVLTGMTHDAFEDQFGHSPASWPKPVTRREFDWYSPDLVYVAEYYVVEEKQELVHIFRGMALGPGEPAEMKVTDKELKDDPERQAALEAQGFKLVRQKRVNRRKVRKYLLSGLKVEEDCGYIAGRHIPVVPFYGKRWVVDGVERIMGHVHLAMDAQRLTNSLMSWLADMAGRFDIEKPIFTPEQISGHTQMWAEDNIKRYAYLLVNPVTDQNGQEMPAAPIGYTKAPNIPPAMAALMQMAQQALEDMLGNQQAGEEIQPNLSGKAVELIQNRLDMQTFIYLSNFRKSMKRCGEIWLSMAKAVLVEESRPMKTIGPDEKAGQVVINQPMVDPDTFEQYTENDLASARFDVVVDVGPSSSSRRAATVRALTGVLQMVTDPNEQAVIISMIMTNLEGEGMEDLREFYRNKLVRMGALKPTEEEAKRLAAEQANQQPDPNSLFILASAEKAQADAAKAQADTRLAVAKEAQVNADTIATLAGVEQSREQHAVDLAQQLATPTTPAQAPAE